MAADGGSYQPSHAAQVCATCKARKKKCDKVLPRCGYCVRKGWVCTYESRPQAPSNNHAVPATAATAADYSQPAPFSKISLQTLPTELNASEASLYLQAHGLIRATGQFVDDISSRYFQGIHHHLPFISRARFHDSLITLGATPSAGFSVLLVGVCLASSSPERERCTGEATNIEQRSLYLAARSLFAQVQALFPPSLHLIQAGLLLALYEYVHGRPDEAFASIASCARMAYATRIHLCNRPSPQAPWSPSATSTTPTETDTDRQRQRQTEEAANTWWGIVICERIFFCEVTVPEQPLVTIIPTGDARLPTEPQILEQSVVRGAESAPYNLVSSLGAADVGGFGRTAQAAWLLEQVLKGFEIPSVDSRLIQLQGLDTSLQAFLGMLMQQRNGRRMIFCEAIAITIRALFTLHWHILSQRPEAVSARYPSLKDWSKYSDAALQTATKMVLDVAEANGHANPYSIACVSPSYSYIVRAALKHIHGGDDWKGDAWLSGVERRLCDTLDQLSRC